MNRKKIIAILGTRGLPANYGGFETIANHLSKELSLRGIVVYVSCETKLLRPRGAESTNGAKLVYFPIIECIRNFSEPLVYDLLSVLWFSFRVDYILMLGCYFPPELILPRLLRKKVLVHVDGQEWRRRKFGRFLRFQLKQAEKLIVKVANQVIVDSPVIGEYYNKNYKIRSLYVPTGIEEIQPFEKEEAKAVLMKYGLINNGYYLVIARLEPENNVDLIVNEFKKSNSKKKLAIIGPLKNNSFVKHLLENHDSRILFLGGIYEPRVQRTLRHNCFAYIHGHEVGGANPSLIEALSCGNSILAFDCPYSREVSENAAVYFKKTPDDLKIKIEALEKFQNFRNDLAYRLFKQKYTINKMVDTVEVLIKGQSR